METCNLSKHMNLPLLLQVVTVQVFQHYNLRMSENFSSIPQPHGKKIRSRHVPREENVPLAGLLQALQLGGRHGGALALSSLRPGRWPENMGIPQLAAQCWCD